MRINRIERNITVALFFLVLIVFSVAQEQSRVMERAYTGKWNLNAGTPVKPSQAPMTAAPVEKVPAKADYSTKF